MGIFERINSQLQRAVLLGAVLAAVASMPPLHLTQRIDSALLAGFTDRLPGADSEIVIIDVAEFDALPALAPGTSATIVSPVAIALGPMQRPDWAAAVFWLLAIGCVYALLAGHGRSRLSCWLVALAAPAALLLISGTALAAASIWIPAAAPALFLFATGAAALQARAANALPAATAVSGAGQIEGNAGLLDRWQDSKARAVTADRLPELMALAEELSANDETQLAADLFLRIAQLDPRFDNVAHRLVCSQVGSTPEQDDVRTQLRKEMPDQIGRYRLLEPIGQGATGRVYLAWDPSISRLLAIKFIDLSLERDEIEVEDAKSRFIREAELTGQLTHPNIVTVYDVGEFDGRAYFAMEYLNGDVLSRFTAADKLLPVHLTLQLGALVADALDYAHSRNVIHRDIKPANIMYDSVSGDLKVTDFGIARPIDVTRTRTGIVLGTPSFMSPEQIEGRNVKGHTDLFALGVSLYELLTGQLPFRGNSMTDLMFVIANEPHQPVSEAKPGLSAVLDPFFDQALQKDPSDRFPCGADMAAALRSLAGQLN